MAQGGFDVVLGNPPYVRQERFSELKPWLEQNYEVYNGVADLYAYFFELGHKLLNPGGRLGYISSSTFFKTGSGARLRNYLAERAMLEKIVDFGDLQVFAGVTTYPAIVVLKKAIPEAQTALAILALRKSLPDNLDQCFAQEHGTMQQARLNQASWQLEDESQAKLRLKLTQGHPTLKEVYGSPLYGIKTGLNAAFVIDRQIRDRLIDEDPRSAELLKPFFEGKDLKKWHAQPRDIWIIFTRRGIDIEQYPAVQNHLEQFREQLEPKTKSWPKSDKWPGRKAGPYQWFEIQDTVAYYKEFEKAKVFYPDITDSQKFHLDISGAYSGNTGYFLPINDFYVLGLLNASVTWFFLKGISDSVRGGFYRMFSQNINRLPIPSATVEQKNSIGDLSKKCQVLSEQRYAIENNFRRRFPDLCPAEREATLNTKLKSWWLLEFVNFQKQIKNQFKSTIPLAERNAWQDYLEGEKAKIATLNRQISQYETELNHEVYRLFKLTPQEIQLIEA